MIATLASQWQTESPSLPPAARGQVRAAELNNLPTPELKAKLSDLEAIKQKCASSRFHS